jgi:hypothetical protein
MLRAVPERGVVLRHRAERVGDARGVHAGKDVRHAHEAQCADHREE